MVVIAVAAILLGIGVPAFGNLIQSERLTSTVNDFFAAINLTRSEAIRRGVRVDLVPREGGWNQGWEVFVDANDNQKPDAGEEVIFMHGPLSEGMSVAAGFDYDGAVTEYLAYNGSGRTRKNASSQTPMAGTFHFKFGDQKRNIVINMLGRPYVCVPKDNTDQC
jgi:type IV fimbrial biogenesis protein FimT